MMQETERLLNWLKSIKFDEYYNLFEQAAYDLPTVSRMTPEDLTAIGITKPEQRRKLKNEINKLKIEDGIPNYWPSSLDEWFQLIRLTDYVKKLKEQGYTSVEKVLELTWEDLEEIGIKKLGHQKKMMLAIKKLQSLAKGSNSTNGTNSGQINQFNHYSSASSLQSSTNLNSSLNSLNSSHSTSTSKSSNIMHNLYLPLQSQPIYGVHNLPQQTYQEIAINTNRNSTKLTSNNNSPLDLNGSSNNASVNSNTSLGLLSQNNLYTGTPTTPELKTFQQLSTNSASSTTATLTNSNITNSNHQINLEHIMTNGSISSSSNSLASSLNNSSNSTMNLPSLILNNGQYHTVINNGNNMPQSIVLVSRGRSMESIPQPVEPIYGVKQIINGQTKVINNNFDRSQCSLQVVYANGNQLNQHSQIVPQHHQTQNDYYVQQNANDMYLVYNNKMDGTTTLNRPKNLMKNRPVAKIAAKSRDHLNGSNEVSAISDNLIDQKQNSNIEIYGNLPLNAKFNEAVQVSNYQNNNNIRNNVITNNLINSNITNGYVLLDNYTYANSNDSLIYENNVLLQQQKLIEDYKKAQFGSTGNLQDRNSYIYATLKRKKVPPPIPKRTNSVRTNNSQMPLTAPTTPLGGNFSNNHLRRGSLEDPQNLLAQQLNQLALAQKLKQQLNQRSSCSNLEVMQEEAFATCVKSLTSRFSINAKSYDNENFNLPPPPVELNSTSLPAKNNSQNTNDNTNFETSSINLKPIDDRVKNLKVKINSDEKLKETENNIKSNNLNESQNSDDFPPPPSPSVLELINQPKPSSTPPLPPPPLEALSIDKVDFSSNENNLKTDLNHQLSKDANFSPPIEEQKLHIVPNNNLKNENSQHFFSQTIIDSQKNSESNQQQNNFVKAKNFIRNEKSIDETTKKNCIHECTVSTSSSTESMPFANDNVGTMRPKPNSCSLNCCSIQQQLKQFASSSSSSSLCSSSMSTSSTSSSLSSASSSNFQNINLKPNNSQLICSINNSNNYTVLNNLQKQNYINNLKNEKTCESDAELAKNCINNLDNQNLKIINSPKKNLKLEASKKLVDPPQVPVKPANWPCSPIKQLISPEHVPNVNQLIDRKTILINKNIQKDNYQQLELVKNDVHYQQTDLDSLSPNNSINETELNQSKLTENSLEIKPLNEDPVINSLDIITKGFNKSFNQAKQNLLNDSSSNHSLNVMDDIEAMLANLSTQLDAMLEKAF